MIIVFGWPFMVACSSCSQHLNEDIDSEIPESILMKKRRTKKSFFFLILKILLSEHIVQDPLIRIGKIHIGQEV